MTPSLSSNKKLYALTAIAFICITVIQCILYIYFQIWSIFLIGYSLNVLLLAVISLKCHITKGLTKKFYILAWLCYFGGFTVWCVDMSFCEYVQSFQLHSFWHITAGYGSYLTLLTLVIIRGKKMKAKPRVHIYTISELCSLSNDSNIFIDIPLVHYCEFREQHGD